MPGPLLLQRQDHIREKGRRMTLRRGTGATQAAVALLGFDREFQPQEMTGGVQQGDMRVEILTDEIAAAAWPAPPRNPDRLQLDGRTYTVQQAWPVHEGEELIGYRLWVRGG